MTENTKQAQDGCIEEICQNQTQVWARICFFLFLVESFGELLLILLAFLLPITCVSNVQMSNASPF